MRHVAGLKINWDSGEGDVVLNKEFLEQSALFRADVLKDWAYQMEQLYNATVVEWRGETARQIELVRCRREKQGKSQP